MLNYIYIRTHTHTHTHIHHARLQMTVTYDNRIYTNIVYTTFNVASLHAMNTKGEVEV